MDAAWQWRLGLVAVAMNNERSHRRAMLSVQSLVRWVRDRTGHQRSGDQPGGGGPPPGTPSRRARIGAPSVGVRDTSSPSMASATSRLLATLCGRTYMTLSRAAILSEVRSAIRLTAWTGRSAKTA